MLFCSVIYHGLIINQAFINSVCPSAHLSVHSSVCGVDDLSLSKTSSVISGKWDAARARYGQGSAAAPKPGVEGPAFFPPLRLAPCLEHCSKSSALDS